jgi:hypothetical protein
MSFTHRITSRHVLALTAVVVALVIPAAGFAAAANPAADWFERYAAAHPYGQTVVPTIDGRSADTLDAAASLGSSEAGTVSSAPDWFERYASAHPYGQTLPQALDGRSADTLDAVYAVRQASRIPVDGRSPDTIDAVFAPRPVVFTQSGGFHWDDAGIGAGVAGGGVLMLAAATALWLRHQARQRIQTT